ncbi:hypothetical protein C8F01DRAFT_1084373 [Mycena amicta]|nr:hypothetical protein C8F01DRAFT_1084373 [Mycena amicta]
MHLGNVGGYHVYSTVHWLAYSIIGRYLWRKLWRSHSIMLTLPTTTGPNEGTTTAAAPNNTLHPSVDLAAFLHALSPKLKFSEHLARFTGAGLDIPSLHAIAHWTRPEASDALTRLLARRADAPGLSPFQVLALEHLLRAQAITTDDNLQSAATLAEFLGHPMPRVAIAHHLELFFERGVRTLADVRMLPDKEDWVGGLRTLFSAGESSNGLTDFELMALEKGICRLWGS